MYYFSSAVHGPQALSKYKEFAEIKIAFYPFGALNVKIVLYPVKNILS